MCASIRRIQVHRHLLIDVHERSNGNAIVPFAGSAMADKGKILIYVAKNEEFFVLDHGQIVESMKMYDSDMKVYLDGLANRGRGDRLEEIKSNIAQMKKWWKEGK